MKIGFFLENAYYNDIDFSKPENGNPGLRGTQYMTWIIACKLSQRGWNVFMFAPCIDKMPDTMTTVCCPDEKSAVRLAVKYGIDIMIFRGKHENIPLFKVIDQSKIKCIIWSHNFEDYPLAEAMADCQFVMRNVCVSRQQYERLRDHRLFDKSNYIENGLDFDHIDSSCQDEHLPKQNIVTFLGTLEWGKGFYHLAKIWHIVLKAVPDAQLYVLGKGNIGSGLILGKYQLSDEEYEEKFMKYLTDPDGAVLPSVHFFGTVGGKKKEQLLKQSKVGVAKAGGLAETFCIVAIEFQAYGVPVAAKKGAGLLDTVRNGIDGLLISRDRALAKAIVRLLKDDELAAEMGKNGYRKVRERFDLDQLTDQWEQLIEDVYGDIPQKPDYECHYLMNQGKWLRELNRRFQTSFIGRHSPSILKYEMMLKKTKRRLYLLKRRLLCQK